MSTTQILEEIRNQSLIDKLFLVEELFKEIRLETLKQISEKEQRKIAAQNLLHDYESDKNLTAFTILDREDFYEA